MKIRFVLLVPMLALVWSAVPPLAAQTITENFNAGEPAFTANFVQRGFTPWTYFGTGGTANSGGVRGAGAFTSAAIANLALPNGPGAVFTLGLDFQVGNQAVASSGDVAGVGLLSSTGFGWEANQTGHAVHSTNVNLSNSSGANSTRLRFFRGTSAGGGTGGLSSFSPMLAAGTWYRLAVTYTNTGADFALAFSLSDLGATGVASPTLLHSATGVAGLSELAAAPTLYAGLYGGTSGGEVMRANRLDNFTATAVPEPSALALGAMAVGVLLFARRRRLRR